LSGSPNKPVVLLAEDEWLVRMEIADALLEAGFAVVEVSSGEAAIAYAVSGQPIDLLISDIRLTGAANGWDVAEACRASFPDLPVVYASANPCDEARMVEGGIFLGKPSRTDQLIVTCRRLLNQDA
jgi:CheY-like chemotaxis protein